MDILNTLGLDDSKLFEDLKLGEVLSKKTLSDPEAVQEPISYTLQPFSVKTTEIPSLTLVASLNAQHQIQLFNNLSEDKDQDGFIGTTEQAIVPFDATSPVLKYKTSLEVNASAKLNTGGLSLGVNAGTKIFHFAYLKHPANTTVRAAILSDFKSFPFIFSLDRVKNLQPGEALAFNAYASFGLSLDFDPVDLLSAGVSALSKYIGQNQTFSMNISATGSLGVNFSATDNFELIFTKNQDGSYNVKVKKSKISNNKISAGLQINAAFSNPEKVSDLINSKIDDLLNTATNLTKEKREEVTTILTTVAKGSVPFADLSEVEKLLIEALATRLKIPDFAQDALNKAKELLGKITDITNNIQQEVIEVAKKKFTAGFSFEYSSISQDDVLIDASLTESALEQTHKSLVLMSTEKLISEAASDNGVTLRKYLRTQSTNRRKAWGFAFGLGNYKIGGSDSKTFNSEISIQYNNQNIAEKEFKVTYRVARGYQEVGSLGGDNTQWLGVVGVHMSKFELKPTMDQFAYNITLDFDRLEKKIKSNDKETILDLLDKASAWDIINDNDLDNQANLLLNELTKNGNASNVNFSFKLNITPEGFNFIKGSWLYLLRNNPNANLVALSQAFGSNMPYLPSYSYRNTLDKKADLYGQVWQTYFINEGFGKRVQNMGYDDYASIAKSIVGKKDVELGNKEGRLPGNASAWFGGIVKMNPDTGRDMLACMTGFKNLLENIEAKSSNYEQDMKRALNNIALGFGQLYYVQALGAYFISLANNNSIILQEITSVLEVTYTDAAGASQTIQIQKNK
ncbi:MAG TPA: hypothetical protein DCS93_41070 [Microscillaceae bacterium]|nr:hypothetical protein [Microscillaceae bacterium]